MTIIKCTAILLLFFYSTLLHAQGRASPSCHFEQIARQALIGALNSADVLSGTKEPPGTLIMLGPFGDPLYQASGWEKRAYTEYMRQSLTPLAGESQRYVQRFTVQQHFMWNSISRVSDQVKFATSSDQGCVGQKTVAEANITGEAGFGEAIVAAPMDFDVGYRGFFDWGRNFYIFDRQVTYSVTVFQYGVNSFGSGFGTSMGSSSGGAAGFGGGCSRLCLDTDM